MKNVITALVLMMMPGILLAQSPVKKTETATIQTSAICGECKERIESAVYGLKGIKSAELNLEDSKLTVSYSTSKVTAHEIKNAVSMVGYDADEMPADETAYQKLPKCCQKDTPKH